MQILFRQTGIDTGRTGRGFRFCGLAVCGFLSNGPYSEVRVARDSTDSFVINPTFDQLEKADMDLMVGATYENIMMVEGEMSEVSELDLLNAMKAAHEAMERNAGSEKN